MPAVQNFEFRRKVDGLIYRFERMPLVDGSYGYKRIDADVWIVWHADFGWSAVDPESDEITGLPWALLPKHQSDDVPPEGEWVSKKKEKSYVYELVYTS